MTINWMSFLVVAVVAVGSSVAVTVLFSVGVRLLAIREGSGRQRSVLDSAGLVASFGAAAAIVLYGLWLILSTTSIFAHH